MADYAQRYIQLGARVVGGCCGTSPRHIAAIRRSLDLPSRPAVTVAEPDEGPSIQREPRSLREKLAAGAFVVSVELDPPRGFQTRRTIEAAAQMLEAGCDCINIGDSPLAEVRMSAIPMAAMIAERAGVEPIVHFSTRDRNLMALQADLMGAHAFGLRNVLCIKGDPHALGSYTQASAVWDLNALGLIRLIKGFNEGHDALNKPLLRPTRFLIGAAVNPQAADLEAEVKLARRKIEAGASSSSPRPSSRPSPYSAWWRSWGRSTRRSSPASGPSIASAR
jgi:homocysteine S-methyltransferase